MADGKLLRFWFFLKDCPEEIIGSVCFQNFLKDPYQSCSIGYKISHKYIRQGYAFEGVHKGLEIVFNESPLHRVEAFIMPNNEPSLRLIERLSFVYEGVSYSYAHINGIWSDHRRYALIHTPDCS
jgi:ribosomal-protein-alanine N-acetyltransferase